MASLSMNHSAPASSSRSCKYDIFLSFRGEDTRKTFVDHLYYALNQHLIVTYKDDETLPRGESIRPSLFKAIEESRIAVIIFSKNYVDSSWCLEELVHIMKCKEERELIVMPIFYDVAPSEVRKQKVDFEKAFSQQEVENIKKAQILRNALVDASNIAGWEPKHIANGHESEVIKEIVDTVLGRLFPLNAEVDEALVGMKTRLDDLKSQLDIGSDCVRMVGIWGGGGCGKTTLATSICMELCHHFQGHCIVENIREESNRFDLKKLQETMLSAIFKREVTVPNVAEGKQKIKTMLCNRNVLIVLDDVNNLDQLDALAGSHSWFGNGSRVIITTRDEHLLRTRKVEEICHVRLLSNDEAMQLFNKHAYNEKIPIEDYRALSSRVVSYASGLPLAVKVLGSFLYDKEQKMWMSTLDRLKDIPEMEIVEKLKISYDGLKAVEKELFLDIACFWRGESYHSAMEMLEACGYHPGIGIEVLRQKALITVSIHNGLDMHDLVQEMGHYIVRGDYPNNLEKHSRLWKSEEINNMRLTMENDKIEAVEYHVTNYGHELDLISQFCKSVSNMKKLRYLKVAFPLSYPKYAAEGPDFLSNELRFIEWSGYPATTRFPYNFQPTKLVVLKLSKNIQKDLWKGYKHLPHLKVLHLNAMVKLLTTPDFNGLPSLQKLTLDNCCKLKSIHPTLGHHKSLQYISVRYCYELRMFPTIAHMDNLKTLEIVDCFQILEFPKIQSNMESLLKLYVCGNAIEVLPSSIGDRCTNLISLHLSNLYHLKSIEFKISALKQLNDLKLHGIIHLIHPVKQRRQLFPQFLCGLQKLDLGACRFKNVEIPSDIVKLSNLQELSLGGNDFSRIDFSLVQFTQLKLLQLSGCTTLLELPELPSSLICLNAKNCNSLTTFGDCHKNCTRLCQVIMVRGSIINDGETLLESMLEVCIASENYPMFLQLEGTEVAKGFIPCLHVGDRCRLQLPESWCKDYSGFLMCAVFTIGWWYNHVSISMKRVMGGMDSKDDVVWEKRDGDKYMTWVWYVSFGSLRHSAWWDQTYKALEFQIADKTLCSGFGVKLADKKSRGGLTETSTDSTDYTPLLKIVHDSASSLMIRLIFDWRIQ